MTTSSNANGPLSYEWTPEWIIGSSPPPELGNTPTISELPAGWYSVTVTDVDGCTSSDHIFLNIAEPTFQIEATADPICLGETGTAHIAIVQGSPDPPMTYAVKGMPSTSTNEPFIENLMPGTYNILARDGNGCEVYDKVKVKISPNIELSADIEGSCNETSASDSILLQVSGGTPPLSYQWNDGTQQQPGAVGILGRTYFMRTGYLGRPFRKPRPLLDQL